MESRDHYINSARIATSVYEVLIEFDLLSPSELSGSGAPETVRVRMSPQHAKSLAALLVKQMREYERQFGVRLALPADVQALWDEINTGAQQP